MYTEQNIFYICYKYIARSQHFVKYVHRNRILKFSYCERATKFEKISHLILTSISTGKTEIYSKFCDLLTISELQYTKQWKLLFSIAFERFYHPSASRFKVIPTFCFWQLCFKLQLYLMHLGSFKTIFQSQITQKKCKNNDTALLQP